MEPKKRKLAILAAIIDSYVERGEPVGSKSLVEVLENSVSSATIRNDMAALAESGYLEQPHTSAGRIPSQRGYRMYVDRLMNCRTLPEELMKDIDLTLTGFSMDPEHFLKESAHMLSEKTHLAAVASTPASPDATISGVEIIATGQHTCLLMVILSSAALKTRICRTELDLTPENTQAVRVLMRQCLCGHRIAEINGRYIAQIKSQLGAHGQDIEPLLIAAREAARECASAQVMLGGQAYLLERGCFSDEALRGILRFTSDRQKLASLMSGLHGATSVRIGSESGHPELSEASVIVSRYCSSGGTTGWVGVIGPTRMNYSRVIPYIEYFSTAVGRLMSAIETDYIE